MEINKTQKRYEWYISDNRMSNCAVSYLEFERAVFWKNYLEQCCAKNGPYIIHGIEIEVRIS
jgi:hypothetical protein